MGDLYLYPRYRCSLKYHREIQDHREINSNGLQSQYGKSAVVNKSKFGAFFFFHLPPPSNFWKQKHLYPVIYVACGGLMTALLRKPSELEVENNDYLAEDVIQKVKEQNLQGFCSRMKCHPCAAIEVDSVRHQSNLSLSSFCWSRGTHITALETEMGSKGQWSNCSYKFPMNS